MNQHCMSTKAWSPEQYAPYKINLSNIVGPQNENVVGDADSLCSLQQPCHKYKSVPESNPPSLQHIHDKHPDIAGAHPLLDR